MCSRGVQHRGVAVRLSQREEEEEDEEQEDDEEEQDDEEEDGRRKTRSGPIYILDP